MDYQFYQNTVDVIIPDVLRSIPNALTQAIRNFAKNLEIWLCESMLGVPEQLAQIKTSAVSAFCQTLRRYTSLNHLAQAARAVLQNGAQISQMLSDLNRVDFHNVQVRPLILQATKGERTRFLGILFKNQKDLKSADS